MQPKATWSYGKRWLHAVCKQQGKMGANTFIDLVCTWCLRTCDASIRLITRTLLQYDCLTTPGIWLQWSPFESIEFLEMVCTWTHTMSKSDVLGESSRDYILRVAWPFPCVLPWLSAPCLVRILACSLPSISGLVFPASLLVPPHPSLVSVAFVFERVSVSWWTIEVAFVFERFWRSFLRAFPYIIPVVLHFGHYCARRLLALRKSWPKEWATSKNEEIAVTQDVDNTQALAPVCRGGGCDGFHTPLKDKKRHDDEMFLLRTCSTWRSDFEEDLLRSCEAHTASCQSKATTGRKSIASATSVEERTLKKNSCWQCQICMEEIQIDEWKKASGHYLQQSSKQLVLMRKGGKGGNDTYKFSREAMATTSQFGPSTLAGSQVHGGWYVGSIQLNERPSVLCIQEASCWDQQWLALQHVMRSYGYRGFRTGGRKIGEKHEQRQWHRGILTFIDEKMEAIWLGECSWKGGQFHAVASSTTIVLLKLIPSCNRFGDFLEQVQRQGNWIIMGDFNEVYDGS